MKRVSIAGGIAALVLAAPAATPVAAALAHGVHVTGAWSRPVPAGLPMGVVYLTVVNPTATPDRLIGASTPVAARMELHRTSMSHGVASMATAPEGVAIPAHGQAQIAPNGYHFMLIGLKRGLTAGGAFPATVRFAHAGAVKVEVKVLVAPPAAAMPGMR